MTGRDRSPSTTPTTSTGLVSPTTSTTPTTSTRLVSPTTSTTPTTSTGLVSPTTSTDRPTITQSPSTTQGRSINLISPITSTPTRITQTTITDQRNPTGQEGYADPALKFCDNAKQRLWIGEILMALLLRLDAFRGVREYRKKVVRRVIQFHEAVDSIAQGMSVETADSAEIYTGAIEENTTIEEAVEDGDEIACREINRETFGVGLSIEDSTGKSLQMAEVTPSERAEESITVKEAIERAAAENEALKGMVEELCERSQQQCDLLSSLVQRVEHLESRVQDMEQRERETKIH